MRTESKETRILKGESSSFAHITWECPACNFSNCETIYITADIDLERGFEIDRACFYCNRAITVECPEVSLDF